MREIERFVPCRDLENLPGGGWAGAGPRGSYLGVAEMQCVLPRVKLIPLEKYWQI